MLALLGVALITAVGVAALAVIAVLIIMVADDE